MAFDSTDDHEPAREFSTQIGREMEVINGPRTTVETTLQRRHEMRELKRILEEDNKDFRNVTPARLAEHYNKQDELFGTGDNTENLVLDAANLGIMTDTFRKISKRARAEANTFDINDFLNPLRHKLGLHLPTDEEADNEAVGQIRKGELGDWERIGWMAAKRARTVMGMESMNGIMAVEHKKRELKKRAKQAALGAEVRPVEMNNAQMRASKNETTENVSVIWRALEAHECSPDAPLDADGNPKGTNFYEWIVNPNSFSQSVENLFYTSFLVREGKLAIDFDEEGVPRIYDCTPGPGEEAPVSAAKTQEVLEFDMDTWRDAIATFNITKCIIPDRTEQEEAARAAGEGWY